MMIGMEKIIGVKIFNYLLEDYPLKNFGKNGKDGYWSVVLGVKYIFLLM